MALSDDRGQELRTLASHWGDLRDVFDDDQPWHAPEPSPWQQQSPQRGLCSTNSFHPCADSCYDSSLPAPMASVFDSSAALDDRTATAYAAPAPFSWGPGSAAAAPARPAAPTCSKQQNAWQAGFAAGAALAARAAQAPAPAHPHMQKHSALHLSLQHQQQLPHAADLSGHYSCSPPRSASAAAQGRGAHALNLSQWSAGPFQASGLRGSASHKHTRTPWPQSAGGLHRRSMGHAPRSALGVAGGGAQKRQISPAVPGRCGSAAMRGTSKAWGALEGMARQGVGPCAATSQESGTPLDGTLHEAHEGTSPAPEGWPFLDDGAAERAMSSQCVAMPTDASEAHSGADGYDVTPEQLCMHVPSMQADNADLGDAGFAEFAGFVDDLLDVHSRPASDTRSQSQSSGSHDKDAPTVCEQLQRSAVPPHDAAFAHPRARARSDSTASPPPGPHVPWASHGFQGAPPAAIAASAPQRAQQPHPELARLRHVTRMEVEQWVLREYGQLRFGRQLTCADTSVRPAQQSSRHHAQCCGSSCMRT